MFHLQWQRHASRNPLYSLPGHGMAFCSRGCADRNTTSPAMIGACLPARTRRRWPWFAGVPGRAERLKTKGAAFRSLHKAARARAKLGGAPETGCPVSQRFVPSVARRGGRGAGRRKNGRLVRQIAEADRERNPVENLARRLVAELNDSKKWVRHQMYSVILDEPGQRILEEGRRSPHR